MIERGSTLCSFLFSFVLYIDQTHLVIMHQFYLTRYTTNDNIQYIIILWNNHNKWPVECIYI